METDPGPEEIDVMDKQRACDVCRATIPLAAWERHVKGLRHKNATKFMGLKNALDESERDKNGIAIEGADEAVDFSLIEFTPNGIQAQKFITVSCTHAVVIKFVEARISSRQTSRAAYSK
jgi:helicase MOV-10